MIILYAVETVVPFTPQGKEWKQIPPHDITAMAKIEGHFPLSLYVMKLCQDGHNKYWKQCIGERVESGIPYIVLKAI